MMDKQIKAKWVKALRSGKYKQGRQKLARGGRYCCLGVLRKIAFHGSKARYVTAEGPVQLLPKEHLRACGLSHRTQQRLAGWNDSGEWDFPRIADYIEKKL